MFLADSEQFYPDGLQRADAQKRHTRLNLILFFMANIVPIWGIIAVKEVKDYYYIFQIVKGNLIKLFGVFLLAGKKNLEKICEQVENMCQQFGFNLT